MRSEREKMLEGSLYDPFDPELVAARTRARDLCQALNATGESQTGERRRILAALFGAGGDTVWMQPPFYCDYGTNIALGTRVFFNFNCVVLDVCPVRIGTTRCLAPRCRSTRRCIPGMRSGEGSRNSASRSRSVPMCGWAAARSFCRV